MGYLYAFLASLFFTFYAIPKKRIGLKPNIYVLFMGISCFFISIIFYFIFGKNESIYDKYLLLSLIGGGIWYIASCLFFYSIDKIGLARSSEFKSLQGPIGSILMLTILSEYVSLNVYLLLLAIIFIFLASLTLVVNESNKPKIKFKYIIIALMAAFLYGLTGFIRKVVTIQGLVYIQQVYTSLGLVLISLIYLLIKKQRYLFRKEKIKSYTYASLSGMFYYFASFFMLLSYKKIEGSIALPIIQLNSIWSGIIGIVIFKEINCKKHYRRLLLGLLMGIIGIVLLVIC